MTFVLYTNGRAYVRACPPEQGFAYTADAGQALKFASAAEALAYLTTEYPVRQYVPGQLGAAPIEGPIVGKLRRRSDLPHYVLNIGDL